jgi:RNA polymerase sigma factor (sigma-70 family)
VLSGAWEIFYGIYSRVLRGMAKEFRLDRQAAEDLVQDVWIKATAHLQKFRWRDDGAGLRGWFYTILQNQARDALRRITRRPVRSATGAELGAIPDREVKGDKWKARWDRELLRVLLADLRKQVSPVNYRLLHLHWLKGRSVAEIAAA